MDTKLDEVASLKSVDEKRVEQRGSERFPCRGSAEILLLPPSPRDAIHGRIHNLSEGGCYVETDKLLEVGSRVAMVILIDRLELRLIAQVRNVKADPKRWAGLEFVGITAEGMSALRATIEKLAREKHAAK